MPRRILFCLILVLCISCSRSEPRIPFGFIDLVYYPGRTGPVERFSFFVLAEDDDGIENLNELKIYYERFGLEWVISSNEWVYLHDNGRHWIGSRAIAMTDNNILPRGQYKAVLINKAGDQSERVFTFDAPETPRFPFPVFSIHDGIYQVNSLYPENSFIIYNQEGDIIGTTALANLHGNITDLDLPSRTRHLALWAKDESLKTSALTEALPLIESVSSLR